MNPTPSQLRWTGLFLAGGLALALVSVVLLLGSRLSRHTRSLICEVRGESVSGVTTGGKVQLRGIEVGSIVSIGFNPSDPERIQIGIEIDPKAPVYADASASLEIFGITGLKYLELVPGTPSRGLVADGAILPVRRSQTSNIIDNLDTVVTTSARVLDNLEHLTRSEMQGRLDSIFIDLRSTTRDFAEMAAQIRDSRFDSQLTRVSRQLESTIRRVDSTIVAGHPDKAIASVDSAATALANVARRADLMLGRSQNDVYRSLEDMRTTMRNLSDFSQTIRDNPAALIRSGAGERNGK